uniref:ABC transporter domain-containing protein n=2 Tax=Kalanchoe fedtschenkoi TaxID=63787 RepID=A0A7N0T827_KALFE
MAQMLGTNEIESLRIELSEIGKSLRSSFRRHASSFRTISGMSSANSDVDDEYNLQWAEIERLPTYDRLRSSLFDESVDGSKAQSNGKRVIDVTKLGPQERHMFIEKLIKHIENDNLRLLRKYRKRIDRVGVKLPTVEVRYKNLSLEAECKVVHGKPLPTLWNAFKSTFLDNIRFPGSESSSAKVNILNGVSGIIKPGRMTLLLGPPGCGKTSLLLALSGNLGESLKVTGEITYNGYTLEEFVPQKTSAYISQNDLHIPEMTVRETIDFSARCQGVGSRADIIEEVTRREKEAGIVPDPDIDTYMKATSAGGQKASLQTDYILKILGLDICSDTMVGDAMRRGISGGQKKRLTTAEMIVGPTKALFMDEITNGLDSSTAYQIVACLQHLVHITDATVLISLLQPAPETFDLFDDIILMAEGKIVYHGPRDRILEFFEHCGFKCPERKGVADFLQEVISSKDQAQYWNVSEQTCRYVSVDSFHKAFKDFSLGKTLDMDISKPYDRSQSHESALSFSSDSIPKWELFRVCLSRELLLMRRNSFVYVFKTTQLVFIAFITMTLFLRTRMHVDLAHSNYYMGALFYALLILHFDGFPELAMTVGRLAVFYKHKALQFYPAWAYAIPATALKVPLSLLASVAWTSLTYYVIGFTPEISRFLCQIILLFAVHLASLSAFRFIASCFQTMVAATTAASLAIVVVMLFGGFVIPLSSMPSWLKWGFWVSIMTYGEIGLSVNEFRAPRWQKATTSSNTTVGTELLRSRGLDYEEYFFWISVGALFSFTVLFNVGFALALSFLKSPSRPQAIISHEKLYQLQGGEGSSSDKENLGDSPTPTDTVHNKGRMVLPFKPLTMTFNNVQYYIDTPLEMKQHGFPHKRLQLLCDITGSFRPGVLTALMGVSGAGKTTLLDVLSGRKTTGTTEGEIRIGGFLKVQETFARISGYCEQTDIHSPQITVEESVIFSAWLRLPAQTDSRTKMRFVNEVLETIELDGIKHELVGIPGVSGLSTEQRKRLTIAVELVANPSIIFLDEPTTGLDARAAAIVMRAVKNISDTGRTIVCTIHQPSIDIFEAFDEVVLLKSGGRLIYAGPLGINSGKVIEYFEGISGVPKIKNNYNPATWMLEVTSLSAEAELGLDFAQIYRQSSLYKSNEELSKQLSFPPPSSVDLQFATRFSQSGWGQFKSCLWKQNLSYWRSPSYNLLRIIHIILTSLFFGLLFLNQGKDIKSQQDIFQIMGVMFASVVFSGVNQCANVLPYVATERNVLYRERYAGMYTSWAYSAAQVVMEIPYMLTIAMLYFLITYPLIGYYWTASKVFWHIYAMFSALLYFSYMGMLLVSLTPNFQIAAIVSSACYTILSLFTGFIIPQPRIPKWWIWVYYLCPTSWTMNALLTSQYGDLHGDIDVFGKRQSVSSFLEDYFGYHHGHLPLVGVMLIFFPILYASLFSFFVGKLNFQRR